MRIAVDAMGGDFAPLEIVKGAVEAAKSNLDVTKIFLVGDKDKIEAELKKYGATDKKIEVFHASEVISMDESPAQAIRRKKDSSVGRAIDLVKQGDADAIVSAGNTGAVVVGATLKLRLLEGVDRPAIATIMPTQKKPFVLVDAGANIDCNPRLISQFAVMGSVYSKIIFDRSIKLSVPQRHKFFCFRNNAINRARAMSTSDPRNRTESTAMFTSFSNFKICIRSTTKNNIKLTRIIQFT